MRVRVLVVGTAPLRRRLLSLLSPDDTVASAVDGDRMWSRLGDEGCDLLLVSRDALKTPEPEAIAAVRELPDSPEVIVVTPVDDAGDRARLLGAGAFSVLHEALPASALRDALAALVRRRRESLVTHMQAEQAPSSTKLSDFASESVAIRRMLGTARRVAATDASLLVLGETGVGKEWLARAIHAESARSAAPFLPVNCAAFPESLLESELFGHEKGAFTGAVRSRRGYFEMAEGGTLFLDEIGEIHPGMQVKLLRFLQERQIQRLGSERPISVDVRIIAASNRDLEAAIAAKEFRQDFYYRLSVVTLTVAPLRERREDIPVLALSYLDQFRRQFRRPVSSIDPAAMAALEGYAWPGNVRELVNVIERAVLLSAGEVLTPEDLPFSIVPPVVRPAVSLATDDDTILHGADLLERPLHEARDAVLAAFEREYLSRLLARCHGRIADVARLAAVDPRTLYNLMRRRGLRKEDFR